MSNYRMLEEYRKSRGWLTDEQVQRRYLLRKAMKELAGRDLSNEEIRRWLAAVIAGDADAYDFPEDVDPDKIKAMKVRLGAAAMIKDWPASPDSHAKQREDHAKRVQAQTGIDPKKVEEG